MYNNKLAVALKAHGRVLREFKDTVYVPFGTEYSIFIKNMNSVRVSVRINVDGQEATENVSLVIYPNSDMELSRFIKNGNLHEGNRFKFIERTSSVEQHRGVGVEDGLVRIEFQYEKLIPIQPHPIFRESFFSQSLDWYSTSENRSSSVGTFGNNIKGKTTLGDIQCSTANHTNAVPSAASAPINDVGITVPGSVSNQQFNVISSFPMENEVHVMILRLLGENPQGQPIIQPVTVERRPTCVTCGRVNKLGSKFCSNCGTSLQIVA